MTDVAAAPFDPEVDPLPAALLLPEARGDAPVLALVAGEGPEGWTERAVLGLARGWADAGIRLALLDAGFGDPSLRQAIGEGEGEGLTDAILYGASVQRIARKPGGRRFIYLPPGTPTADPASVLAHPRWESLLAGFRQAGVTVALHLPADLPGAGELAGRATFRVLLGRGGEEVGTTPVLASLAEVPAAAAAPPPEAEPDPPIAVESSSGPGLRPPPIPTHRLAPAPVPGARVIRAAPPPPPGSGVVGAPPAEPVPESGSQNPSEPAAAAWQPGPGGEPMPSGADEPRAVPSPSRELEDLLGWDLPTWEPEPAPDAEASALEEGGGGMWGTGLEMPEAAEAARDGGPESTDRRAGPTWDSPPPEMLDEWPQPGGIPDPPGGLREDSSPDAGTPDDPFGFLGSWKPTLADPGAGESGGGLDSAVEHPLDRPLAHEELDEAPGLWTPLESDAPPPVRTEPEPTPPPPAAALSAAVPSGPMAPERGGRLEPRPGPSGRHPAKPGPRARPARRRSPVLLLLLLLALLLLVLGAARLGFLSIPGLTPGPELSEGPIPRGGATPTAEAAVAPLAPAESSPIAALPEVESRPSISGPVEAEPSLAATQGERHALALALNAYSTLSGASGAAAQLRAALPGHLVVVAPVQVGGQVFHRLLVAGAPDTATVERFRQEVAPAFPRGQPSEWIVREADRGFLLQESASLAEARTRVAELEARGIPAYLLELSLADGVPLWRVHAGAYGSDAEARLLGRLLEDAGETGARLVPLLGRPPA